MLRTLTTGSCKGVAGRNLVNARFVPAVGTLIAAKRILSLEASADETRVKRQVWQETTRRVRKNTMIGLELRDNNLLTLVPVKALSRRIATQHRPHGARL